MERYRLRVRHEPKRGSIWELHLFPDHPYRPAMQRDARLLGSCSSPEAIQWLRHIAASFLERAPYPAPITADKFGPGAEPRWLKSEDGMRLALAFPAATRLKTPAQRRQFQQGLETLPSEVLLYWFTLCFYGYRQAAGRAAFRVLLTHDEPGEADETARSPVRKDRARDEETDHLFADEEIAIAARARDALAVYNAASSLLKPSDTSENAENTVSAG